MKISVTKNHILAGKVGTGQLCPIALAIKDAIHKTAIVSPDYAFIEEEDDPETGEPRDTRYSLPWRARRFVLLFDHNRPVEPFEFEL